MKIGILGSGPVAQRLGSGFIEDGHDVVLGTRDPSKLADWRSEAGERAGVGSFADAAAFGDVVVIATFGMAALDAISAAGKEHFDAKIVMDTTNPLRFDDAGPHLAISGEDSLGERIQQALANAKVVKVFNTVGNELMVRPSFPGGPADMFLAGNDEAAKRTVAEYVRAFAWNPVDLGDIENARYLEAMCLVWITYGRNAGTWNHAFKFVKSGG